MSPAILVPAAQSALIRALLDPRVHGPSCVAVRLLETHISYVLLTGEYAYKIKKAVNLGFLDFTTLEARQFYCQREHELNAQFAASIYLGVVRITGTTDAPAIDGLGPTIEYAVKMREFPQDALLSHLIAAGEMSADHIDTLADEVAAFHLAAPRAADGAPYGTPDQVLALAIENFTEIVPLLPAAADRRSATMLRTWTESEYSARRATVAARRVTGFVRACHGDLHLGNIALIDGRPTLFDCVEFNETMRWSDVMADVGFLTMDLIDRGQPAYAFRFLNRYFETTGDYEGLRLLRFYSVYRAMVRAKVAAMRSAESEDPKGRRDAIRDCRQYLRLARRLTRSRDRGLIITHGPTGAGKTTGTERLLEDLGAIRIRTDVERKRLHAMRPLARATSPVNEGIYSSADTERTYAAVEDAATIAVESGYMAIADGTFLRRAQRDRFAAIARALDVPFAILDFHVDTPTLVTRVDERRRRGTDASDATRAVLDYQLRTAEPLDRDEVAVTIVA